MKTTMQSETGRLRRVVMKHPREAVGSQEAVDAQWTELRYTGRPDYDAMCREADELRRILAGHGVDVLDLPAADGTGMDSLYARDASIVTDRGVVLCSMGKEQRVGEPEAQRRAFEAWELPLLGVIDGDGRLEGGDCVWLDASTVAVGRGYRTNAEGIDQLRTLLGPAIEVIEVPAPHFRGPDDVFHVMSMISPVDSDAALVFSPTMPVPFRQHLIERGVRLIEVPESEYGALGPNVLALSPRLVLACEGAPETASRLRAAGVEVVPFAGAELCLKGHGGPTCLMRPLEREP